MNNRRTFRPDIPQPLEARSDGRLNHSGHRPTSEQRRFSLARSVSVEALNISQSIPAQTSLQDDRLLSRKEICAFLGVSYTTVWSWMRAGKFPRSIDLNGIPKWRESDVRRAVDACPERRLKPLAAAESGEN
ncbi:MAG: AlpA family phage regulatory protein [Pseudolabrys sp.]|nr:AlpA family phage regulatory protein [Pseudolabrys sp.]